MKPIHLNAFTDSILKNCESMVREAISKPVLSDKFTLTVDLKDLLPELTGFINIWLSLQAYAKIQFLVAHCDKEVAVHGTVFRREVPENSLSKADFYVDDIFVYPQEASAATVAATDDYGPWLTTLSDEIFNHLRFQLHSHVDMNVSPSGVDTNFYHTLLQNVQDFYIFMIVNKRHQIWCEVYDVENNMYYETKDVHIHTLLNEDQTLSDLDFAAEIASQVANRPTYTPPPPSVPAPVYNYREGSGLYPPAEKKRGRNRDDLGRPAVLTKEDKAFIKRIEAETDMSKISAKDEARYFRLISEQQSMPTYIGHANNLGIEEDDF